MGISYNAHYSTYTITAFGEVINATVTNSGSVAAYWVSDILERHHPQRDLKVGLDVEWCPHGFHGTSGANPVALLQLCVDRRCLIFQLIHCNFIPQALCDFLGDAHRFVFMGVGIEADRQKLQSDHELFVGATVNLPDLAARKMERPEVKRWGLKNLVKEVMGEHLEKPKSVQLSNWGKRTLSSAQIEYAAVDAFASFEVGRRFFAGEF